MLQPSGRVRAFVGSAVSVPRRDDLDEAYAIDVELKSRLPAARLTKPRMSRWVDFVDSTPVSTMFRRQ